MGVRHGGVNMQDESGNAEFIFYGPIRALLKKERIQIDALENRSLREVLLALGIPAEQLLYTMALINGKRVDLDASPSPGDRVDVFQPVGGG
jgi:molybdopterin converting factor small subunit